MAKQTFTTGSVLTATQMNNLQANDYNWTVSQKTASYVLVAADAGTRIEMNAAGSTTVTVNTGLFTAGDSVIIQNIGAGTCTVTAGTATVNKATNASLALAQYQGGTLYFVSASSAIFFPFDVGTSAGAFAGVALTKSASQSITSATATLVTWNTETYDTDNFHDNSTNTDRITIPSGKDGYYLITCMVQWDTININGNMYASLSKNGTQQIVSWNLGSASTANPCAHTLVWVGNLVATDYIQIKVYQNSGSSVLINNGSGQMQYTAQKIG